MEDKHFNQVFWFICWICTLVLLFDCAVIFIPVPPGGQKYADILVGSLNTGALMAAIQYLLGGSPQPKKADSSVTTNTDTGNVVVNAPPVTN